MAIQERLADNASRRPARGAPRDGRALLAGIAVCGRCGHQVRVAAKAHHRYVCNALSEEYRASGCLSVGGPSVDAAVVAAFFEALAPAELALLDEVLSAERADRARVAQHYADHVKRAEYEARLAQRRYQVIDPDNRLVAAELERQWELALRTLAEVKEEADRFAAQPSAPVLDPTLRAQLADLGPRLPELWQSGRLTPAHRKELLRCLIRRVVLRRTAPDTIEAKVVWISGAYSVLTVHPPVHRGGSLAHYAVLVARILALAAEGYQDSAIAQRLSAEGFRSARRPDVPRMLVEQVRRQHGVVALTEQFRRHDQIDGRWTVGGLARRPGVSSDWVRTRIAHGTISAALHPRTGRFLIDDDPALLGRLQGRLPARHPEKGAVS